MAITYTWTIANLERNTANGGVTVAHWRCTGTETVGSGDDAVTYTASQYGTTSHTPDADAADFIAYDTDAGTPDEATCIGWAKAALDVDAIEDAIEANITEQKTPTTGSGVPW